MEPSKKDKIRALLKSIETGDTGPVAVVNEAKYIQHNPQTHEGSEGLAVLFKRLSLTSPRVNIVRAFEDGDFVFAHTEYDFAKRNIGFEVFRFEDGQAVEHWDNIQCRQGPNAAGHSMVDGPTEAEDHVLTEANRTLVRSFVETVLVGGEMERMADYLAKDYTEYNPRMCGLVDLRAALESSHETGKAIDYQRVHRVLAEGSFVLCVSEGIAKGKHSAFYDLFRVMDGRIVEHWDTTEKVALKAEWKNDNGKF
ncbi:MAG: hypothetical protein GY952_08895 [Rhodobacteraceae bacterium]|nr:hypothetical protein [Paracoccaceae bacterium]